MPSNTQIALIADAGGTKTRWTLLDTHSGDTLDSAMTAGINAAVTPTDAIARSVSEASHLISRATNVYFYGAGCASPQFNQRIYNQISQHITTYINIHSDMLGAARAMLQNTSGIAAILGTGSNSCLYDGTNILSNVPPMGYILGDEGSGAALGKRLLTDTYRGILPRCIKEEIEETYNITYDSVISSVYRPQLPAQQYLASFAPFVTSHLHIDAIHNIAYSETLRFFDRNIALYDSSHTLPLTFTGSLANALAPIIRQIASAHNYNLTLITPDPSPLLVKYHTIHHE